MAEKKLRQVEDEDGVVHYLQPLDLDELEEWFSEGGCEAACPHCCWVEPDGHCEHGHPSWLLAMGMI
jgi:hypothetical protein